VFGAVARGAARERSDLDLLVRFEQPIGLRAKMELKERATCLLGRRVELATAETLHWLIRPYVLDEAVPL
jgi:predicted nucleotidyltransferase